MTEGLAIALGALGAVAPLFAWLGLMYWARKVGARYPEGSPFRRAWMLPVAGIVVHLGGFSLSSIQLALAFRTIGDVPVEERAATLAQAISEAMNLAAFGLVVGAALGVTSIVVCVVGQVRAPKDGR